MTGIDVKSKGCLHVQWNSHVSHEKELLTLVKNPPREDSSTIPHCVEVEQCQLP